MIRFPQFLIARLWTDEYGDPDVAEEFAWLHAYSPYHHVVEGDPLSGGAVDHGRGRHAGRPAARPQDGGAAAGPSTATPDDRPILLHQEGRAGHGVGKPVSKQADEQADVLAFFTWQLGVDGTGPQ